MGKATLFTSAEYARLRELKAEGYGSTTIARLMGRPRSTVTHKLARLTEDGSPRATISDQVREWVGERNPNDFTGKQAADALGLEGRAKEAACRAALQRMRRDWQDKRRGDGNVYVYRPNPYHGQAYARAKSRVNAMIAAGMTAQGAIQQVYQETGQRVCLDEVA